MLAAIAGGVAAGDAGRPARAGAQQITGDACRASVPLRDALERVAAAGHVRLSYSRELIDVDRPVCGPSPADLAGASRAADGGPGAAPDVAPSAPPGGRAPVLAALDALLRGTGVEALAVGGGQVVLAPAGRGGGDALGIAARPAVLERVVVTGNPAGAPARALPVALSVLDGAAVGMRAQTSLATALDGAVPGLWLWTQPTTTLLTRYAGLRGASSFGLTTPKLYLDGVEVANPLFVTALSADQVERVEVIRGPQGAALYGADAISGVINIVTRHDGADGGRAFTVRSGVGGAGTTSLVPRPALAQDYGVTFRAGGGPQTAGVSVTAATLGPVVPGSTAHQISAIADARRVARAGVFTFTARFADAVAPPTYVLPGAAATTAPPGTGAVAAVASPNTGSNAALQAATTPSAPAAGVAGSKQHISELTLAANAVRTTGGRWTHTFTAGLDAYRLSGVASNTLSPIPSPLDSAQGAAQGSAARATLRASSTATYDAARDLAVTVTGIADYGLLREATQLDAPASVGVGGAGGVGLGDGYRRGGGSWVSGYSPTATPATTLGTLGAVAQTTLAWHDAYYLTAGLRAERNDGFTAASRAALLPSIGLSTVRTVGGATLKVRTAYGSGLRPAPSAARVDAWHAFGGAALPSLAPEAQTGVEGGVDVFFGPAPGSTASGIAAGAGAPTVALHLTAFDQQATGLIQQVAGSADAPPGQHHPPTTGAGAPIAAVAAASAGYESADARRDVRAGYVLQDVGAISNRGVEGEAELRAASTRGGVLSLGGTFTYVDSHVRRTVADYSGDLRPGDRVLEVPRWTLGANATWRLAGWATTLGAARAFDWVNYDRLALAAAVRAQGLTAITGGQGLRAFWRTYPGATRLRAEVSHDFVRGVSGVVTGENLLDQQTGEPDNVTVVAGRTLTAGVRARF